MPFGKPRIRSIGRLGGVPFYAASRPSRSGSATWFAIVALTAAAPPAAGQDPRAAPVGVGLSANVAGSNLRLLRESQTVIIPTVLLNVAVGGALAGSANGRSRLTDGGRARAAFAVRGYEKAYLQDLARRVQDDFVRALRGQGFTVLTYDDIRDRPAVMGLARLASDPRIERGLPAKIVRETSYLTVAPSDGQQFKPALQGSDWPFRGLASATHASVVVPELFFDVSRSMRDANTGDGTGGEPASLGLSLVAATARFVTPAAARGQLTLREPLADLSERVGQLAESGSSMQGASRAGRLADWVAGLGRSTRRSFVLTVDPGSFAGAVTRGSDALTEAIVRAIAKATPP